MGDGEIVKGCEQRSFSWLAWRRGERWTEREAEKPATYAVITGLVKTVEEVNW